MKTCIYISAVSNEFSALRRDVAEVVGRLGFEPVTQENFPTGHGELRDWLGMRIAGCEGLIQIVGTSYGTEPPDNSNTSNRVSHTQYELLLARSKNKKTWVFVAADGAFADRDRPEAELDWPQSPVPDPAAYQAERRMLQAAYREKLRADNHVLNVFSNRAELREQIFNIRDELGAQSWRWRRLSTKINVILLLALAVVAAIVAALWFKPWLTDEEREAAAAIKQIKSEVENVTAATERIKLSLNPTEQETRRALIEGLIAYFKDNPRCLDTSLHPLPDERHVGLDRETADAIRAGRGSALRERLGDLGPDVKFLRDAGLIKLTPIAGPVDRLDAYGVRVELTDEGARDYWLLRPYNLYGRSDELKSSFCYAAVKVNALENYRISNSGDYEYATLYYRYTLTDVRPWAKKGAYKGIDLNEGTGSNWLIKTGNGWVHNMQFHGNGYSRATAAQTQ